MRRALFAPLLALLGACNAGPDEPGVMYMPDMVVSTAYDAHDRNPVLANGMTLQAPPEGAIPRGYAPYHYGPGPDEAAAAGGVRNPLTATEADLARGQVVFETFCAVCHGASGAGDGTVVPPFPNPPALTSGHTIGLSDGRLYHVITRGQGFMPSYAAQVRSDDRWRAVLYVRSLQGAEPEVAPEDAPDAAVEAEASPEAIDGLDPDAIEITPIDAVADEPANEPVQAVVGPVDQVAGAPVDVPVDAPAVAPADVPADAPLEPAPAPEGGSHGD